MRILVLNGGGTLHFSFFSDITPQKNDIIVYDGHRWRVSDILFRIVNPMMPSGQDPICCVIGYAIAEVTAVDLGPE